MLAQCGMNDAAVEQNLGGVGNLSKHLEGVIEIVVVIAGQRCHPGLDFLPRLSD